MAHLRRRALSIPTALGPLRVEITPRGVCCLDFRPGGDRPTPADRPLVRQLQSYAAGKPVKLTTPVNLDAGTEFQRAVWTTLRTIPRGETRSYAWVARQIGRPRAARAVGAACGANPVPLLVPCHRVIASDGSLGGFSGGLALKRRLLALESGTR